MKEPGTVKQDSQKGEDLRCVGEAAATGGQIGGLAGATSGSVRGIGIGGVSGIVFLILSASVPPTMQQPHAALFSDKPG